MQTRPVHSEDNDDISKIIGRAVSVLLASGKSPDKENILAALRDAEQHSVDGTRKLYSDAVRKVNGETDAY